jgi:hypothetical protein
MRVRLEHKLQPAVFEAHSVVVEDDGGNPIFVALQHNGHMLCANVGDSDFQAILGTLGIDKTVTVTEIKPKPIENVIWSS